MPSVVHAMFAHESAKHAAAAREAKRCRDVLVVGRDVGLDFSPPDLDTVRWIKELLGLSDGDAGWLFELNKQQQQQARSSGSGSGASHQALLVTNVGVGTVAHDDDVRAGDILLAVNDAPIAKTGDPKAVKRLFAASQRPLRLTFERPAQAGIWDDGGRLAQFQLEQGRKKHEKADARTTALEAALKEATRRLERADEGDEGKNRRLDDMEEENKRLQGIVNKLTDKIHQSTRSGMLRKPSGQFAPPSKKGSKSGLTTSERAAAARVRSDSWSEALDSETAGRKKSPVKRRTASFSEPLAGPPRSPPGGLSRSSSMSSRSTSTSSRTTTTRSNSISTRSISASTKHTSGASIVEEPAPPEPTAMDLALQLADENKAKAKAKKEEEEARKKEQDEKRSVP